MIFEKPIEGSNNGCHIHLLDLSVSLGNVRSCNTPSARWDQNNLNGSFHGTSSLSLNTEKH